MRRMSILPLLATATFVSFAAPSPALAVGQCHDTGSGSAWCQVNPSWGDTITATATAVHVPMVCQIGAVCPPRTAPVEIRLWNWTWSSSVLVCRGSGGFCTGSWQNPTFEVRNCEATTTSPNLTQVTLECNAR